jgi:hypothetical protein
VRLAAAIDGREWRPFGLSDARDGHSIVVSGFEASAFCRYRSCRTSIESHYILITSPSMVAARCRRRSLIAVAASGKSAQ